MSLAGFAIAANPVAAQVITTPTDGLTVTDTKVTSSGFQVPIYEARPAAAGRYPVVLVIPEVWGMHEHIKDVTRRFAKEGFLAITFESYAREGGTLPILDMFKRQLKGEIILVGLGLPDDNWHSPNEKMDLENYQRGIAMSVELLAELTKPHP